MNQKGFTPIIIILGIVLILGIAGGVYFMGTRKNVPVPITPKACTQEAKICPDGSAVGRTGSNCEFSPCPTIKLIPLITAVPLSTNSTETAQECNSNDGSTKLTLDEAKQIASRSDCLKEGTFTNTGDYCNNITETWWLTMKLRSGNCGLACVVNVKTKSAKVQYMCTGASPSGI